MATHVVVNDDELLEFFSKLGEGDLTDEMYQEVERFVCKMYGSKTITSINHPQNYSGLDSEETIVFRT